MKTYNLFIVKLDKTMNDTIKTDSGLELYIDTRFDEFEHRVTEVTKGVRHSLVAWFIGEPFR